MIVIGVTFLNDKVSHPKLLTLKHTVITRVYVAYMYKSHPNFCPKFRYNLVPHVQVAHQYKQ